MKVFAPYLVLLSISVGWGANHYIRSGATGNGNDWANALPWLMPTLVRGDTYYIADGTYPGYVFDDAESGTSLITIKKATALDHGTDTGWDDSYGDSAAVWGGEVAFRNSYYVFDGQTGGGPGQWRTGHGFVIPYTSGWGCLVIGDPGGSQASRERDRTDITIRHTEAYGPVLGGEPCGNVGGTGLLNAGGTNGHNNLTYSYLWLHDLAIQMQGGRVNDLVLEYSCLERNASSASCHSEAWAAWGPSYRVTVRYNIFSDIEGTAFLATTNAYYWEVYGNIFSCTPGNPYGCGVGNGVFGTTDHAGEQSDNCQVHNNIFVNLVGLSAGLDFTAAEGTAVGNFAYNNLWYNNQAGVGFSGVTHDYSWFYGNPNNASLVSAENNAQGGTGDPFVDSQNNDFRLKAATEPGMVLDAPFTMDPLGNGRGADGVWDRGAYEFVQTNISFPIFDFRFANDSPGPNPLGERGFNFEKAKFYKIDGHLANKTNDIKTGVYVVLDGTKAIKTVYLK